jgi:3-hydroxyisobutyrate dehydrogenase-like beta-hydroxyacid dehydrogenase
MEDPEMKVGFAGLGNMGSAMARDLIKAGHSLIIYNRTRARAEEFRALGAKVADSPTEAASDVEAFITMLADDHAVESVILEPGRAIQALPRQGVHVSMSTISVAFSRRLAGVHQEKGQFYVAAPVFGRPEAAATGKLYIVAAGPAVQIQRCQSLFEAMGQKTFSLDEEAPMANLVKLTGNFMITTVIESLAESFALARKSGLDPKKFLNVLTDSLFAAPVYRTYGTILASNQFDHAGFKLRLGLKDNHLVMAAADEVAVSMPMASLVHERFVAAIAQGLENADWAGIARIAYQNAGLKDV